MEGVRREDIRRTKIQVNLEYIIDAQSLGKGGDKITGELPKLSRIKIRLIK